LYAVVVDEVFGIKSQIKIVQLRKSCRYGLNVVTTGEIGSSSDIVSEHVSGLYDIVGRLDPFQLDLSCSRISLDDGNFCQQRNFNREGFNAYLFRDKAFASFGSCIQSDEAIAILSTR
jgi:hypothetical protein